LNIILPKAPEIASLSLKANRRNQSEVLLAEIQSLTTERLDVLKIYNESEQFFIHPNTIH
jgi:hypothetical protein